MMGGFNSIDTLVTNVGEKIPNPLPLAEKASVLCKRHNEMLGGSTDAAAIRVLKAIESASRGEGDGKAVLVSGHDFERFLFQRLAAHHFGEVFTADGEKTEAELPISLIEDVMVHNRLPNGAGLYIGRPPEHHDPNKVGWEVTALYAPSPKSERRSYAGIRFSWRDYAFFLMLDGTTPFEYRDPERYRPMGISILRQPGDTLLTEIWFSWPYGTEGSGYVGTHLEFFPPSKPKPKPSRVNGTRKSLVRPPRQE